MTDTEVMGSGMNFTMQNIPRMRVGVIGVLRQKIEVFGKWRIFASEQVVTAKCRWGWAT